MEQLVRIKYIKDGPITYISHLNLTQVFTRSLRRANIPVVISGGFNPRFRISFGPPLPLGISSTSEYLDIRLKERLTAEKSVERLNRVLPQGLKILHAKTIPSSTDSLIKAIDKASYVIILRLEESLLNMANKNQEYKFREFKQAIEKDNKRFVNLDEITVEKQTKNGIKKVNIRPSILNIRLKKLKKQVLEFSLEIKIGQQENLNPRYVAKAWISNSGNKFDIQQIFRDGLYVKDKEVL